MPNQCGCGQPSCNQCQIPQCEQSAPIEYTAYNKCKAKTEGYAMSDGCLVYEGKLYRPLTVDPNKDGLPEGLSKGTWEYVDLCLKPEKGDPGEDGADGQDGTDGVDGTNGTNGTDGVDGTDGADGTSGADGEDGITPHIDPTSGNWFIGAVDTGVHAEGPEGPPGSGSVVNITDNGDGTATISIDGTDEGTFCTSCLDIGSGTAGQILSWDGANYVWIDPQSGGLAAVVSTDKFIGDGTAGVPLDADCDKMAECVAPDLKMDIPSITGGTSGDAAPSTLAQHAIGGSPFRFNDGDLEVFSPITGTWEPVGAPATTPAPTTVFDDQVSLCASGGTGTSGFGYNATESGWYLATYEVNHPQDDGQGGTVLIQEFRSILTYIDVGATGITTHAVVKVLQLPGIGVTNGVQEINPGIVSTGFEQGFHSGVNFCWILRTVQKL